MRLYKKIQSNSAMKANIEECQLGHKKRKDSLETRAALLIFLLDLEISGVAVQSIHKNSEKWQLLLGTAQKK